MKKSEDVVNKHHNLAVSTSTLHSFNEVMDDRGWDEASAH